MKRSSLKICRHVILGSVGLVAAALLFVVNAETIRAQELSSKQRLGKLLFFDPNLSSPNGMSCATCHDPKVAFTDPRSSFPVSAGVIYGRFGNRSAPSVAYAAYSPPLYFDPTPRTGNMMQGWYRGGQFWDGRASTLEDQAKQPFLNPVEMNSPSKTQVVTQIRQGEYDDLFKKVFSSRALNNVGIAFDNAVQAIAEYERSSEVSPFSSKYDQYLGNPTQNPLTESEARGLELFTGKANCFNCHFADTDNLAGKPLFTSFGYQNIGVPKNPDNPFYNLQSKFNPEGENFVDLGLGGIVNDQKHYGQFKIPSLRNVAVTAPYMHNGVFKTLREVLDFDNTRDVGNYPPPEVDMNIHRHMPPLPGFFGQLGLTDQEIDDIIAFLMTLTDGYVK